MRRPSLDHRCRTDPQRILDLLTLLEPRDSRAGVALRGDRRDCVTLVALHPTVGGGLLDSGHWPTDVQHHGSLTKSSNRRQKEGGGPGSPGSTCPSLTFPRPGLTQSQRTPEAAAIGPLTRSGQPWPRMKRNAATNGDRVRRGRAGRRRALGQVVLGALPPEAGTEPGTTPVPRQRCVYARPAPGHEDLISKLSYETVYRVPESVSGGILMAPLLRNPRNLPIRSADLSDL